MGATENLNMMHVEHIWEAIAQLVPKMNANLNFKVIKILCLYCYSNTCNIYSEKEKERGRVDSMQSKVAGWFSCCPMNDESVWEFYSNFKSKLFILLTVKLVWVFTTRSDQFNLFIIFIIAFRCTCR